MKKVCFNGVGIADITREKFVAVLKSGLDKGPGRCVFTLNAHHLYLIRTDPGFMKAYESADIVLADGMSVVYGLRLTGRKVSERLTGADMFTEICKLSEALGKKVFILGGSGGSDKRGEKKLKREFKNLDVRLFRPPIRYETGKATAEIVERINEAAPDFLIVCTGAPKTEKWLYENIKALRVSWAFSLGAALDFYSGTKKRAPGWMRKSGMEWLFRLFSEPGRLWKRYLASNIFFAMILFSEILKTASRKR